MPGRLMTRRHDEDGSLPMAILATIVVAGLITVVIARVAAGERAVRFDRSFSEALQVADVGINRGLFALNGGETPPTEASPETETVDGIEYTWFARQDSVSSREWEIVSEATTPSGVTRRIVAAIEEEPLFFPGAFGDTFVGLNGASSHVDSYNSGSCTEPASACQWGTDPVFGTGNGSIGTNDVLDLRGNVDVRPGGAFLYNWDANPGVGTSSPFGDRCKGETRCTSEYVSTVGRKLDLSSDARTGFIVDKFNDSFGGACADTSSVHYDWDGDGTPDGTEWLVGQGRSGGDPPIELRSAATVHSELADGPTSASDPAFENFYCADSLQFLWNVELDETVDEDNPVVIFVRDLVTVGGQPGGGGGNIQGLSIACHGTGEDPAPCDPEVTDATDRQVRPVASRLQIYVAASEDVGNNVSLRPDSKFAGVMYAPLSGCGGPANGNMHVYGMMLCSRMDNVGNWQFHYDDALGNEGTGLFNIAFWREEPPA